MGKVLDLVSRLDPVEFRLKQEMLRCISPDDAKYGDKSEPLKNYLSAHAEWLACAKVQRVCLETRIEYGQAEPEDLASLDNALTKIIPLNMAKIEDELTHHDQLAVLEEVGRFIPPEVKALLHPGTTSYDILDTARSYLYKTAWFDVIRPKVIETIKNIIELADRSGDSIRPGRTHLQDTSPVMFGGFFAGYAARLADRLERCDMYFSDLRGKISGIVGTGASIDMVIGEGKSIEFEKDVLKKLGLEPDLTATQIVQKEKLADAAHGIATLALVLGDFANDVRLLYSSGIGELTSRKAKERLGGSSADATKNNPVNWENIVGKARLVKNSMPNVYDQIMSDLERVLTGSVTARYEPAGMLAKTYEMFSRAGKASGNLDIVIDRVQKNLEKVRDKPSEAMVAILRGKGWVHPKYGVGHSFVKEIGKMAQNEGVSLMTVAMRDTEFRKVYQDLGVLRQSILDGKIENYLGSAGYRKDHNIEFVRSVVND